jgi:Plasmid pRiA4b ORF-3-like protein
MQIIELTITLEHVKPTVMRSIEVPLGIHLDQLHLTVQAAMGWENAHLYMFMAAGSRWGVPDPDFGGDELPASETTLEEALGITNVKTLRYLYNFGDDWMHRVEAGEISDAVSGMCIQN